MFFCNAVCHFSECDNCAQTLLSDLETLDVELRRIKDQMDSDSLRPSSKEHLRKLEDAITATTVSPSVVPLFYSSVFCPFFLPSKGKLHIEQV